MNVGDRVYIVTTGHWGHRDRYRAGTVTKITPSGLIDVTPEKFVSATRFSKDLRQLGNRYGEYIDTEMPFAERAVWLARIHRIEKAAAALASVEPNKDKRRYDTKEELTAEFERLQALMNIAEELIKVV